MKNTFLYEPSFHKSICSDKEPPVILIVDDEFRNLRLMEALLIPMGYEIIVAADGYQALEKVEAVNPDVILLDIMMPRINGFEVARKLKSNEKTCMIPIVMITNLTDVEDRVKAIQMGADDFLSKPVEKIELQARVRSLIKVKAYYDHLRHHQEQLESEVAERTRQLQEAYSKIKEASLETIYRLSRAAEYKDEGTGSHIHRVSNYASLISRQLGLNAKTTESILLAAPMHDVGKIGIPDRILLKTGKLEPDEWQIMKKHTIFGGKILEGSEVGFIRLARVIALTHHEKWDGTGYPEGLKKRQIPLAGRIMAVADVFDALISKRPYKKSLSVEKSLQIIKTSKGTHFDPEVVDAFLSIQDEIMEVKKKYSDDEESLFLKLALSGSYSEAL